MLTKWGVKSEAAFPFVDFPIVVDSRINDLFCSKSRGSQCIHTYLTRPDRTVFEFIFFPIMKHIVEGYLAVIISVQTSGEGKSKIMIRFKPLPKPTLSEIKRLILQSLRAICHCWFLIVSNYQLKIFIGNSIFLSYFKCSFWNRMTDIPCELMVYSQYVLIKALIIGFVKNIGQYKPRQSDTANKNVHALNYCMCLVL